MKIERIKVGEVDFTPESFGSVSFQKAIEKHCSDVLKNGNGIEQGILNSGFELLKNINAPRVLEFHEQIVLACMEVKAAIDIIGLGTRSVPSREELQLFTSAQMADILHSKNNPESIVELVRSIIEENKVQSELEENAIYIELLGELDYSNITLASLKMIYSVLEESEFDEDLVAFVRQKNIGVYYSTPIENATVVLLRVAEHLFYVKNAPQILSLTHVENHGEVSTNGENIEYYSGISFSGTMALLRIEGNVITWSFYLGEPLKLNNTEFAIVKNHDTTVDVYDITNNVLYTLSAETYYDLQGKGFRFFLDTHERYYLDFFGNRFTDLKTVTANPLLDEPDEESIENDGHGEKAQKQ